MAGKQTHRKRKSVEIDEATAVALLDPQTVLAATEGARSDVRIRKNEAIFRQGEPADSVFYVRSGRIQLTVVSDQGKEGVIALCGPGDFLGEGCLAGGPIRMASAISTTPSVLARIEKGVMSQLLHDKADFAEKFMSFLVSRTIQVEADLVDQLFNSSEKRLARLLLLLANFNNDGELRMITPKISQEMLAARVGTTRSRINYFMNKFRRLGLIEYNGEVKVHTALINVIVHD
jgi:CRP/FNR family transcriptional regulator, cyclic AMP receptor protein